MPVRRVTTDDWPEFWPLLVVATKGGCMICTSARRSGVLGLGGR